MAYSEFAYPIVLVCFEALLWLSWMGPFWYFKRSGRETSADWMNRHEPLWWTVASATFASGYLWQIRMLGEWGYELSWQDFLLTGMAITWFLCCSIFAVQSLATFRGAKHIAQRAETAVIFVLPAALVLMVALVISTL